MFFIIPFLLSFVILISLAFNHFKYEMFLFFLNIFYTFYKSIKLLSVLMITSIDFGVKLALISRLF